MSSTIQNKPSGEGGRQYVGFEEYIDYQLKQARRGIRGADLLTGGVGAVLMTVGYLFLFVVTDHWLVSGGWSQIARYAFWLAYLGAMGAWLWVRFVHPWSRSVTALYAASQLENTHPELRSNLFTLVDLQQAGRPISPAILEAMERRAAMNLQQVNVDDAVDRQTLTKLSYALLAMVVVLCIYTLASPKSFISSAWRGLFPMANVSSSTRTTILEVKPGNLTVLAHATPEIEATLSGVIPPEVRILYTTADRRIVDEAVVLQDTGEGIRRFRGRLLGESGSGLLQNISYRIEAGDAVSPTYSITVRQPPTATVQDVFYEYPRYMGLDNRTQTDSAIDAWEGTSVTVRATTNVPVDSATILFSDTENTAVKAEELPMQIQEGVHLSAKWLLRFRADGTFPRFYRIQLSKKSATGNDQVAVPTLHTQRIRADLPPKLEILHPTSDVRLPANGSLPVAYEASDPDFMLKSVVMKFEKDGELLPRQEPLFDAPPFEPKTRGQHRIKLDQFALEPSKTLTFWLEAKDNFEPFGERLNNLSRSPKITITVIDPVAPEQAEQEFADQQQQADEKIEAAEQAAQPAVDENAAEQPQESNNPEQKPADQNAKETGQEDQNQPSGTDQNPMPDDDNASQPSESPSRTTDDAKQEHSQNQPPDGKPQRGRSQPESDGDSDASSKDSPSGQPQPGTSSEGDSQSQPAPQKPPKNGSPPMGTDPQGGQGTPQTGKPQDKETSDSERPPEQPQRKPPAGTPASRPRPDKASPDEVLDKLIQRQKKREQQEGTNAQPADSKPSESQSPSSEDTSQTPPSPSKSSPEHESSPANSEKSPDSQDGQSSPSDQKPGQEDAKPSQTRPGQDQRDEPGRDPRPQNGAMKDKNTSPPDPSKSKAGENSNLSETDPMKSDSGTPETAKPSSNPGDMPNDDQPSDTPDTKTPQQNPDGPEPTQGKPSTGSEKSQGKSKDKQAPNTPAEQAPMPQKTGEPSDGKAANDPQTAEQDPAAEKMSPENQSPSTEESGNEAQTKESSSDSDQTPGDTPAAKDNSAEKQAPKSGQGTSPDKSGEPMPGEKQSDPQNSEPTETTSPPQQSTPKNGAKPKGKQSTKPRDPSSSKPPQGNDSKPNATPNDSDPSGDSSSSESGMPGESPSGAGTSSEQGPPGKGGSSSKSSSQGGKPSGGQPSKGDANSPSTGESNPSEPSGTDSAPMKSSGDENNSSDGKSSSPAGGGTQKNQKTGQPKSGASPQKTDSEKPEADEEEPVAGESTPTDSKPSGGKSGSQGNNQSPDGQEGTEGGPPDAKQSDASKPRQAPTKSKPPQKGSGDKGQDGTPEKPAGDKSSESGSESGSQSSGQGQQGSSGSGKSGQNGDPDSASLGGHRTRGPNAENLPHTEEADRLNAPEEAIDLENRKKAAGLAITKLLEEMSRGEKPQELMDELGYSEEDLENFLKQFDQDLNQSADPTSPEAQARRRQFEELLKGIELDAQGELKSGGDQPKNASQSSGSNRRPTPKKYESSEEAFRRRMQRAK